MKWFEIPRRLVFEAWEKVWANKRVPGVDAVALAVFPAPSAPDGCPVLVVEEVEPLGVDGKGRT